MDNDSDNSQINEYFSQDYQKNNLRISISESEDDVSMEDCSYPNYNNGESSNDEK